MEGEDKASSSKPRYISAGDPDLLRNLVHQKRTAQQKIEKIERLSETEAKSLRGASQNASGLKVSLMRAFSRIIEGVGSAFGGLCSGPIQKNKQCAMYGHRAPTPGWSGEYPICEDCGKPITDLSEIRGATPKQ